MPIGVAGWSLRRELADRFGDGDSQLARYATRLDCVEINSSFYRPHRASTYARWAASVPDGFRFSVKLPRAITHEARLRDCETPLLAFLDQVAALGDRRGPLLVQLPPSLGFEASVAAAFLAGLRARDDGPVACEPRHPSWFEPAADALLRRHHVARVAADPAPVRAASMPGGWDGLRYVRLHGSPIMYASGYGEARLRRIAHNLADAPAPGWCIFDNTARGEAVPDALMLRSLLLQESSPVEKTP